MGVYFSVHSRWDFPPFLYYIYVIFSVMIKKQLGISENLGLMYVDFLFQLCFVILLFQRLRAYPLIFQVGIEPWTCSLLTLEGVKSLCYDWAWFGLWLPMRPLLYELVGRWCAVLLLPCTLEAAHITTGWWWKSILAAHSPPLTPLAWRSEWLSRVLPVSLSGLLSWHPLTRQACWTWALLRMVTVCLLTPPS